MSEEVEELRDVHYSEAKLREEACIEAKSELDANNLQVAGEPVHSQAAHASDQRAARSSEFIEGVSRCQRSGDSQWLRVYPRTKPTNSFSQFFWHAAVSAQPRFSFTRNSDSESGDLSRNTNFKVSGHSSFSLSRGSTKLTSSRCSVSPPSPLPNNSSKRTTS